jgi:DNA-binding protein H-NS
MARKKTTDSTSPRRTPKAKPTPLDRMSYRDLLALQTTITEAIAERRAAERRELAQKLEDLATSSGFSLPELLGRPRAARAAKKEPSAVLYRHPSKPNLTWSGRGRRPKWLVEAGRNINRYRVA